jgi:diphosphomevalonate decarboxylase
LKNKKMKASAISNSNIALSKYWGKRDEKLILPFNSSISMTTHNLTTHTTVDFKKEYSEDVFILNGEEISRNAKDYQKYIGRFLNIVREKTGNKQKAKIVSQNNFPTAAGLASSASGFAALSTAINQSLNLNLNKKELSKLTRLGSGSSTRSVYGGFVKWNKGEEKDGSDSFAEQIINNWANFRMIVCVVSKEEKKVKSRLGMAESVKKSPYYKNWVKTANQDVKEIEKGIRERDFSVVGQKSEMNCLKMHAVAMTTKPEMIYWGSATVKTIKSIIGWRNQGLESYFTIDAGPQVKIMCLKKNVRELEKRLRKISGIKKVIITKPGQGSQIINKHLF